MKCACLVLIWTEFFHAGRPFCDEKFKPGKRKKSGNRFLLGFKPVLFKLCHVALAWNKKYEIGNCCFCIFVSRFYFLGNRNLLIHALES